jgi:alanine dehydrogenase
MALILREKEVEQLLDPLTAMEVLEPVMLEEVDGTSFHMPPFGGGSSRRRTMRFVGGGLYGLQRMGVRVGGEANLYDTETGKLLAVIGYPWGVFRVGVTMALGARYLARPDAHSVGLLGSGRNALNILVCLKAVRPIDQVKMYSPTADHRKKFAEEATAELGIPVTALDDPHEVIQDVDIIAVGTNSETPVLSYSDLKPGTHVTSMGVVTELDESIFLQVDQFVAPSRSQELDTSRPTSHPHHEGGGHLHRLVEAGRYDIQRIVELGSIIRGDVAPRNGPQDINLFRDSRGGVGDIAFANYAYERARELGLGIEVDL